MRRIEQMFIVFIAVIFLQCVNAKTLSIKQTVEINRIARTVISPNGKLIAYSKIVPRKNYQGVSGKPFIELHITDLLGQSKSYIVGNERIGNIVWGAKNQFIYFIAQRQNDQFVSIYKMDINGGEALRIIHSQNDISAFTINHNGQALTYLAKPKISQQSIALEKSGFNAIVFEESQKNTQAFLVPLTTPSTPHLKLSISENILSIKYHPTTNVLLAKVTPTASVNDRYTASTFRLYQQDGKLIRTLKTQGKIGAARWSPNGKSIAFIAAEDKNDPRPGLLYLANSETGKIKLLTEKFKGHVKDFRWINNDQLLFLGHKGTTSELSVIDVKSNKTSQYIDSNRNIFTAIDASTNGSVVVGVASKSSHPKELFLLSNKKIKRLTDSNPWLFEIKQPKQVSIHYIARDGVDLEGILIYPENHKHNKRYPLIIMVHGGPESHVSNGWIDSYSFPVKFASSKGFAIFLPNYRGSTGRGVAFSKLGQRDYAGAEFNDIVDAIGYLSKIKLIDKKRVGITGLSYGGYASAWAATALTNNFAASVMGAGISDQISKHTTSDIPEEFFNVHARAYPWEKWQWMLQRSPIYYAGQAKTPLLIMHGKKDTRVHPGQALELYRSIKMRTRTPVRLIYYPDEGHGNQKNAAQLDYAYRLMRWMEFYLKGKNKGKKVPPYEIDHSSKLESKK